MWFLLLMGAGPPPLHTEGATLLRSGDVEKARAVWERGCAAAEAESCSALGDLATRDPLADPSSWYAKACSLGEARACGNLGVLAVKVGAWAEAERRFRQGCDLGSGRACEMLGNLFQEGRLGSADPVRAEALYRKGCELGFGPGCFAAGVLSEKSNPGDSLPLYTTGCTLGDAPSCGMAGGMRGMPAGRAELERGCAARDGWSCFQLGQALDQGWEGQPPDLKAAAVGWQGACDQKMWAACNVLGSYYEEGKGLSKDAPQATALYQRSCDADDAVGCVYLGAVLAESLPEPAYAAFAKACGLAEPSGCYNQAVFMLSGTGVEKNEEKAAGLLQSTCSQGNGEACEALSQLYVAGVGVKKSKKQASILHIEACNLGYRPACD